MKTKFNKESGVKTWEISKWYEKVFYVTGIIYYISVGIFILIEVLD